MTKNIHISIRNDIFEKIEELRGNTTRSEFIERMVRKGLENGR